MTIVDRVSNISTTHKCELLLAVGLLAAATVGKRRFDLDQQRIRYFKAGSAALFAHTWVTWSWWEGRAQRYDTAHASIGEQNWSMWAGCHFQSYVDKNVRRSSWSYQYGAGDNQGVYGLFREFPGHQVCRFGNGAHYFATCSYTGSDKFLWQLDRTANLARDLIWRRSWTGLHIPACRVEKDPAGIGVGSGTRHAWVQRSGGYADRETFHDPNFKREWDEKCASRTSEFRKQVGQLIDFIIETDWRNVEYKDGEYNLVFHEGKLALLDLRDINGPITKLESRRWSYAGLKTVFRLLPLDLGREYLWRVPLIAQLPAKFWLRESA